MRLRMALLYLAGAARALSGGGKAVRLDKLLNDAGAAGSRARCAELIKRGRVAVDGATVRSIGAKVTVGAAVTVDGNAVGVAPTLFKYHKPVGVHSTLRDDRGRPDLGSVAPRRTHPVGRLDADTSGLLLFSSDGAATHALLSPRRGVEKEYVADCALSGGADVDGLGAALAAGVETALGTHRATALSVVRTGPASVEVRLVVTEGKHRMVRRMLANCGFPVERLRRERHGAVLLGDLAEGAVAPVEGADEWLAALLGGGAAASGAPG